MLFYSVISINCISPLVKPKTFSYLYGSSGLSVLLGIARYHRLDDEVKN